MNTSIKFPRNRCVLSTNMLKYKGFPCHNLFGHALLHYHTQYPITRIIIF